MQLVHEKKAMKKYAKYILLIENQELSSLFWLRFISWWKGLLLFTSDSVTVVLLADSYRQWSKECISTLPKWSEGKGASGRDAW